MPKRKTRSVEYYRCWPGNSGGSGQWDTSFIDIPADTPEEQIERVVQETARSLPWPDEPPLFVGVYHVPEDEETDD